MDAADAPGLPLYLPMDQITSQTGFNVHFVEIESILFRGLETLASLASRYRSSSVLPFPLRGK